MLVAGADEAFALGLTVALTSALRHLDRSRRAHVFLLDGGLSPRSRARCLANVDAAHPSVTCTVVENDPDRFATFETNGLSRATYLRLLIPAVVPDRYRRALYLDSDLIVDEDLSRMWDLPDEGRPLYAAYDEGIRGTSYVRDSLDFAALPEDTPYFNAGVLFIDLPRWRADRIAERAEALLGEHTSRCVYNDQDALNIVLAGDWSVLPPAWNTQVAGLEAWSPLAADHKGILHFINEKPWKPEKRCLGQERFNVALRASGWYGRGEYWVFQSRRRSAAARRWFREAPSLAPVRKPWHALKRRLRGVSSLRL